MQDAQSTETEQRLEARRAAAAEAAYILEAVRK